MIMCLHQRHLKDTHSTHKGIGSERFTIFHIRPDYKTRKWHLQCKHPTIRKFFYDLKTDCWG